MPPDFDSYDPERSKQYYDEFYEENGFIQFPVANRQFIESLVSYYGIPRGTLALDVGCGTGSHADYLSQAGLHVVGIDVSPVGLSTARNQYPTVDFVVADALDPPFRGTSFQLIFCKGFSPFSTTDLEDARPVLHDLLEYLTDDGLLVFGYGTRLTDEDSGSWIQHSVDTLDSFFEDSDVVVVGRHVTIPHLFLPLGTRAFSPLVSRTLRWSAKTIGHPVRVYFVLAKSDSSRRTE